MKNIRTFFLNWGARPLGARENCALMAGAYCCKTGQWQMECCSVLFVWIWG